MTLILALKYKNGSMLATDTRLMIGSLKRDRAIKLEPLTDKIGIAYTGLSGAAEDILSAVKTSCEPTPTVLFDDVVSHLSEASLEWYKKNHEKLLDEEQNDEGIYSFIAVSAERIRHIMFRGYSEEAGKYDCDGSGKPYAEYLLGNLYSDNLNEKEAKELLVHTILETSKVDPSVSEDIRLLVFPKGQACNTIEEQEIEDIKLRLAPLSRTIIEEQIGTVERIVSLREAINDLCKNQFNFRLFNSNEKAVFQIMKPCRSESEFTSNIAALALLIDQLNVTEIKKLTGEKEGSINYLEAFLTGSLGNSSSDLVSIFRDIVTLRSKKFPIHITDTQFIEVVVKMVGVYPPNWSDLYAKALNSFTQSLTTLQDCMNTARKTRKTTKRSASPIKS